MDPKTMIQAAIALLALTAVGGLLMAIIRFSGRDRPPSWIAMLHGLLAASGLTLLLYAGLVGGMGGTGWLGVALLVLAALGGLYLNLAFHDRKLPLPKGIIVGHAIVAALGVTLVFMGAAG